VFVLAAYAVLIGSTLVLLFMTALLMSGCRG
jgi:hypothetical protein